MATYSITYSCGHTESVKLYGKVRDRENYIEWASEHRICSECREKLRKEAFEKKLNDAREDGLPDLYGTDKQIKWALDLRNTFIDAINNVAKEVQGLLDVDDGKAVAKKYAKKSKKSKKTA